MGKAKLKIVLLFMSFSVVTILLLFIIMNGLLEDSGFDARYSSKENAMITVAKDENGNYVFSEGSAAGPNSQNSFVIDLDSQLDENALDVLRDKLFSNLVIIIILIIGFSVAIGIYLSRIMIDPIKELTEHISKLNIKNLDEKVEIEIEEDNEIYDLIREYNTTMKRMKRVFDDMEKFNSYASHELRNSLAVLNTKIDINEDHREIKAYIGKLNNTVEDMLLLSSPNLSSKEFSRVDMAIVAARVVDEYSFRNGNIEMKIPEDGVEEVLGREIWIYRCICNLIDNSIKYSDKDSKIVIELIQTINSVILKVKDKGIGIGSDYKDYVFEPYYRIHESKKDGHGVGLALVKKVVDLMGGVVWLESDKENGSEFYLAFPIAY